ncbi:MAG: dephospho-CoA kinase [SAR202 cluster bacterium]|nr:dephospho-CoA kinase [SAR202 cluster bacterium]
MRVIGLTGGIGTGKSVVASVLASLGAAVIDADKEAHETYRKGSEGWRLIVARFGNEILNAEGEIDRRKLARIVFADPRALQSLNTIVHPLARQRVEWKLRQLRAGGTRAAVVEAVLLYQAGWQTMMDEVWLVRAPRAAVRERLRTGRRMTDEQVAARMEAQAEQERTAMTLADVVLDNDGTEPELREKVRRLWNERISKEGNPTHG